MAVRKLGEMIGKGAEGDTYLDSDGASVVKTPNKLGVEFRGVSVGVDWQSDWAEHYPRCNKAYHEVEIPIIRSELTDRFEGIMKDGRIIRRDTALVVPYVSDMDEIKLSYADLVDPEIGPQVLRELYGHVVKADHLYREKELGLDPYGGEIVFDLINGLKELCLRRMEEMLPMVMRMGIRRKMFRMRGQIRNVIKMENGSRELMENARDDQFLGYVDLGMHDFSDKGQWQAFTKLLHHLMIGSLIEVIKRCNEKLPVDGRISEEHMADIDQYFNGNRFHKWLVDKLVEVMVPMMDEDLGK